jgi:hypothetical protein
MSGERRDETVESPRAYQRRGWTVAEPEQRPPQRDASSEEGTLKTFLRRLGMLYSIAPKWPGR